LTFFAVHALSYYLTIQNAVCEPVIDGPTVTPKFADGLLDYVWRNI
jgi:hypothetical protein